MVSPVTSGLHPPYLSQPIPRPLRRYGQSWGSDDGGKSGDSISVIPGRTREYSLLTKCIAEFLGDFTFVFIGTMQTVVVTSKSDVNSVNDNTVHAALAHGFTIFILVTALGHISGGHFNPAVSWAVTAAGKMPYYHLPFYMISQLLGGFCGSLYSAAIMTNFQLNNTNAGATLLYHANTWWEGLLSEAVATYFLCHTILLTAVDSNKVVLAPLAIGLTLSIDILSTGSITGASMNPARSLGPNIVGQIFLKSLPPGFWSNHYIYWAGPFMGATVAVIIYKLFEAREDRLVK